MRQRADAQLNGFQRIEMLNKLICGDADEAGGEATLRNEHLLRAIGVFADRDTLKRILENAVPQTLQDVVIIYAAVTGYQDGELREENYVNRVYPQVVAGRLWSAIQVTTAAGICAVLDLVLSETAKYKGFVAQEQFRLSDILDNRFGRFYAHGGTNQESAELVASGQTGHQRAGAGE